MSLVPTIFGGRRSNIFDPFSLDIFDPFNNFQFPSRSSSNNSLSSSFVNATVDWKETREAHILKADLPGMKKEEVKVEDKRVVHICGERNVEKEENNDSWHRLERSSGKFVRRLRLPKNSNMDVIKDRPWRTACSLLLSQNRNQET